MAVVVAVVVVVEEDLDFEFIYYIHGEYNIILHNITLTIFYYIYIYTYIYPINTTLSRVLIWWSWSQTSETHYLVYVLYMKKHSTSNSHGTTGNHIKNTDSLLKRSWYFMTPISKCFAHQIHCSDCSTNCI